ncbi:MAG: hypothetical protein LBQ43_02485 [Holosporales bacterium]|jgi:F0F1-type ATP synthase epsilon subunit|nr:hypothetical protein [Holosporales bacterium]
MSFSLNIHSLQLETKYIPDVVSLSFTSDLGQHEILPNHEPLFTTLNPGKLSYSCESGETHDLAFSQNGFLQFQQSQCDVWVI